MKYKVGDKVKYDGGDWWFYGTVSAVFEHSICPCYRLNVERMEKKSCKFSITQFEFELEPCHEKVERGKDKRKWDNSEIELLKKYQGVLNDEDLSKILKRSPQTIEEKRQLPTNVDDSAPEPEKKRRGRRKQEPKQKVEPEKKRRRRKQELENAETIQKPKKEKRKRGEAWDQNLEMYRNGEKSNVISTWMAQIRKEYKTGKLPEQKLDKLLAINFPFETSRKKKTIAGTND